MDLGLRDKVVVVTGASSGIGYATAACFAAEGAKVVMIARTEGPLNVAANELARRTSAVVEPLVGDMCDPEAVSRVVSSARRAHGRIDVLVNNVGTGIYKPFLELTEDDLDRGMALNFFAPFRVTQRVVPIMVEQGDGAVVNVSGETGIRVPAPPFRSFLTGPGKAALNRFTRMLAAEFGPLGVRVNAVVPGLVDTGESLARMPECGETEKPESGTDDDPDLDPEPLIARWGGRWGRPEEIADLIAFTASPRADFVNGALIVAGGGSDTS